VVFGVAVFTHPAAKIPPFGEAGTPSAIPPQTPVPSVGIGDIQESNVATPLSQPAEVTSLLNALLDNIILLENSKKQNLNQTNNVKLYKSILKQGQALKIDVSFTKAYLPIIVE
jgi:hypothetical protein